MWIYRSLLALVGGACLVGVSAALTRTAASVAPTLSVAGPPRELSAIAVAPEPRADAEAERCLQQALDAFTVEGIAWLQMEIWQKIQLPECAYEADGFYRLAPGQRFRLEMHTHAGEGEGTLLSVSDGRTLWQGMTPLLINLRGRLVWAKSERLRSTNGERLHLVGVWSKDEAMKLAPPDRPWPTALPRQCHVYLDGRTSLPQRVEWWGPNAPGGDDRLLMQMEFRNAVFNRPLADDECRRLFAFQPGEAEVEDETGTVTAEMSKRAGELTPRSTMR
jgi:hypothetical protein